MTNNEQLLELTGEVENIIFRNDSNGYSVMEIISGEDTVVAVGNVASVSIGEEVRLIGKYTTHHTYGEQFAFQYYEHERIERGCHGTGDVYASAFVGALMNDKSTYEAARIAADYTVACIKYTQGDEEHWYGVKFEPVLGQLIDLLK